MAPVRPWRTIILTVASLLPAVAACADTAIEDMPAPEARQAVAVDADAVYAIDSRTIGKYDKRTGKRIRQSEIKFQARFTGPKELCKYYRRYLS